MNQSATRAELLARAAKMKKPPAKFRLGKYNGRTLEWVAENAPGYMEWFHDNVSRSYWPEGFLEAYRETQFRMEEARQVQAEEERDWYD